MCAATSCVAGSRRYSSKVSMGVARLRSVAGPRAVNWQSSRPASSRTIDDTTMVPGSARRPSSLATYAAWPLSSPPTSSTGPKSIPIRASWPSVPRSAEAIRAKSMASAGVSKPARHPSPSASRTRLFRPWWPSSYSTSLTPRRLLVASKWWEVAFEIRPTDLEDLTWAGPVTDPMMTKALKTKADW